MTSIEIVKMCSKVVRVVRRLAELCIMRRHLTGSCAVAAARGSTIASNYAQTKCLFIG